MTSSPTATHAQMTDLSVTHASLGIILDFTALVTKIRSIIVQLSMEINTGTTLNQGNVKSVLFMTVSSVVTMEHVKNANLAFSLQDKDFDASLILSIVLTKTM